MDVQFIWASLLESYIAIMKTRKKYITFTIIIKKHKLKFFLKSREIRKKSLKFFYTPLSCIDFEFFVKNLQSDRAGFLESG